ncbi:MAG: PAS domain-containing protein [Hyphomonadaceae bacterium]|nr:PAS domain-containing protein [Hyphomonadaceae bacterium]
MNGEETFHPDTRALLAYGRALAGAPDGRAKKGGADHVIERLFVIERTRDGRMPIRSFGRELVALFGRDMREHDFARFFLAPDLALVTAMIDACEDAAEPGIVRVTAHTVCGKALGAELLLAPLKVDLPLLGKRMLGMFQPLGGEPFLDGRPIQYMRVGSLHPPAAKLPPRARLVVVND